MQSMKSKLILFLLGALTLVSCNKDTSPDFIKKAGDIISVKRDLEGFSSLIINDEMDVELVQDSQMYIEIEFGKNLIKKIKTDVSDGQLLLSNNNSFNWVRKLGQRIKVKVHFTQLESIEIIGDGSLFNTDTFYGDRVDFIHGGTNEIKLIMKSDWATFRCSNSGGLSLTGSCGILSGTVEETAIFDGKDFTAIDAYFYHYSRSNSYIKAQMVYGFNIFGSGNLYYLQEPSREFNIIEKGSGKVIKY